MTNQERKVSEEFVWKLLAEVKEANNAVSSDLRAQSDAIVNLINTFRKRFDDEPKTGELRTAIDTYATRFENYHNRIVEKFESCREIEAEIYKLLREHCDHSSACFASIDGTLGDEDSFFQSIIDNIENIKNKIGSLSKKVWAMIIVVCVTFSLMTIAYFFVRSSFDVTIEKKMESIEEKHQSEIKYEIERLNKMLREHIRKTEDGEAHK